MKFRPALLAALTATLAASAFAQLPPAGDEVEADAAMPSLPMGPMGPPPGVRKITDGTLSCEQIYAESRALEADIAKHHAASEGAQQEANVAQEGMMRNVGGMGMGASVGSSLLGMVPGGSMLSGVASQAAMSAQRSSMKDSQAKMMASYQRMMRAQEQLAHAQGRNDHLVGLFLQKNCKLPEGSARP